MKYPMLAAAAAVLAMSAAHAADLSRGDKHFLEQAAQNGHAEVEASKLAAGKATNPDVRSFAQQMVTDHTKAGQELEALAKSKGVDVPKEPSMLQKAKAKVLDATDGPRFDARYADEMGVEAHEETIELFQKAARGANDRDVKAFAAKTLPTLRHHLQMARDVRAKVESR